MPVNPSPGSGQHGFNPSSVALLQLTLRIYPCTCVRHNTTMFCCQEGTHFLACACRVWRARAGLWGAAAHRGGWTGGAWRGAHPSPTSSDAKPVPLQRRINQPSEPVHFTGCTILGMGHAVPVRQVALQGAVGAVVPDLTGPKCKLTHGLQPCAEASRMFTTRFQNGAGDVSKQSPVASPFRHVHS